MITPAPIDRGVTHFDTAEPCGPFTNEELPGEAPAPFRYLVVIATNLGFGVNPQGTRYGLDSRPENLAGAEILSPMDGARPCVETGAEQEESHDYVHG